ncbi:MAG: hypothetical protein A9Z00_13615 [Thermobacillus sp. ZCTH02-B1]|uniref:helicase-associated domain-containing protein n=1 Tax=Thermobacillus sp. ZCTH02-B1 TaxID=1858795 RepID=UPI000B5783D0|nr:helicase-associated domain-containing protein [Thermobacillus sp. ZCTH02-B1]OUM96450.1 MAG: hypothetical protein A9Z00_13615 [Thermobacillus sp. ZCTH02-B1]
MLTREWLRRLPPGADDRFAAEPPWNGGGEGGCWAERAVRPEETAKAVAAMGRGTADALRAILIRFGSLPFEPEQFEAAAGEAGLSSGRAARVLERLRAAGIVFTVRKTWGDRLHFVASDAMAAWTAALLPADVRPLADGRKSARPLQDYREPFGLQLMQMLAEWAKRGVVIPADGSVPAQAAAAAAARLSFGPEALEPFAERFGPNGRHTSPLRLGLAAALHLGLLAPTGGRLAWRRDALAAWLAEEAGRRERDLLAFVTDRLAASDARFMHAGALLRSLAGGAWYPAEGIDAWFARHVPEAAAHWRVWAGLLAELGWMQTGVTAEGKPAVRWLIDPQDPGTSAGAAEPSGRIRFMPGAELAVPPDLDLRLRWELELLADRTQPGPMAGMRLSAESYVRWIEDGRTAEEALELLEEAGGCAVPDDLERLIREWDGSAGRIAFREALLLVCDDRAVADRAAAEPAVAERLGERIGDRHFLIDRRHAAELRRLLAKAGIPARSGIAGSNAGEREPYPAVRRSGAGDGTAPCAAGDDVTAIAAGLLTGLRLERYAPDPEIRPSAADPALPAGDGRSAFPPPPASGFAEPLRAGAAESRRAESASGGAGRRRAARSAESSAPDSADGAVERAVRPSDPSPDPGAIGRNPRPAVSAPPPGGDARMRAIRASGLPAHWFGTPRRVHPSTRREMVRRAIEIGAAVRIVRGGAAMDVWPERLEETDDGWRFFGRPADASDPSARVSLDGNSWSEMALVLPEWIGERK